MEDILNDFPCAPWVRDLEIYDSGEDLGRIEYEIVSSQKKPSRLLTSEITALREDNRQTKEEVRSLKNLLLDIENKYKIKNKYNKDSYI